MDGKELYINFDEYIRFNEDNDLFAKHSWYFRNALVRDNYSNYQKKITTLFTLPRRSPSSSPEG
jgi:hypothetical protein